MELFSLLSKVLVVLPLFRICLQILINCLIVLLNVSLLDTLAHNEGIGVLIHPLANILCLQTLSFSESQRYFEDNVSRSNGVPLPSAVEPCESTANIPVTVE